MSDLVDIPDLQANVEPEESETNKQTEDVDSKSSSDDSGCCSMISLRTGCLIFAYFYLAYVIFNLTLSSSILSTDIDTSSKLSDFACNLAMKHLVLDPIPVVIHLFAVPFCVLLLFGLHKERSTHIEIFIFFQLVCATLTVIHRIIALAFVEKGQATWVTIMLAYIAWNIYFIFLLRNLVVRMQGLPPLPPACRLGDDCTAKAVVPEPIAMLHRLPKLVLEKCCFCCIPLRIGCLILAYLYLIGTIVHIGIVFADIIFIVTYMVHSSEEFRRILIRILIILSVNFVLNIVAVPFNILLLVGLHKERQRHVRVYIIFQIVCAAVILLQHIVSVAMATTGHIYGIIQMFAFIAFNVYYLLVLRSHYLKMTESTDHGGLVIDAKA